MQLTWGAFYALLYIYRCAASVFAQVVVMRLTMIADTTGYQYVGLGGAFELARTLDLEPKLMWRGVATDLTGIIGGVLSVPAMGNPILINIGYQTLAFAGIVLLMQSVEASARKWLAILVMLPSFTIWSSIAAKEPVVVFLICLIMKYVLDINNGRDRHHLGYALVLLVVYIYKPHFLPSLLFLIVVSKLAQRTKYPATLSLAAGSLSLILLYIVRDIVDRVALLIGYWVNEPGRSSREGSLIEEKYDVFWNAPEGMYLAFMGPTLAEAQSRALHLIAYMESILMVILLLIFLLTRLNRMPVYGFFMAFFAVFWIMFAIYPLGTDNPGTAVRFRTDFIMIIYVSILCLTSRSIYIHTRKLRPGRSPVKKPEVQMQLSASST